MNDCIIWPGRLAATGYVQIWVDGHQRMAHRLIWEQRHGPIPDGMTIDHICENKACLNPEHFQVVTRGENTRLWAKRRTHCAHGHEMDEANSFYYQTSSGYIGRGCRICRSIKCKRWREERKLLAQGGA